MTTIACDGKAMAGDGLVTGNGLKHHHGFPKVRHLAGGAVVGMTGTIFLCDDAVAFLNGEKESIDLGEDFEALVLYADGRVECVDGKGRRYDQPAPCVTGSGGAVALGAMLAGKTALEAVKIAASVDTASGGECVALAPIDFLSVAA